jgi:hypothetical protein
MLSIGGEQPATRGSPHAGPMLASGHLFECHGLRVVVETPLKWMMAVWLDRVR